MAACFHWAELGRPETIGLLSLAATTCSVGRDGDAIFSPTSEAGGARSGLNSCLRPLHRAPLLYMPGAPLDPVAGPISGLYQPPESPLSGLIWVYDLFPTMGPAAVVGHFFLNIFKKYYFTFTKVQNKYTHLKKMYAIFACMHLGII